MATIIYLVSNAKKEIVSDLPSENWPLSFKGKKEARIMSRWLVKSKAVAIYSSPQESAIETVYPLSKKLGLDINVDSRLRERKLGHEVAKVHEEKIRNVWKDFDFIPDGGESSNQAKKRILQCLHELGDYHQDASIVLSSHSFTISLLINSLNKSFGMASWKSITFPDVFRVIKTYDDLLWDKKLQYREKRIQLQRRARPQPKEEDDEIIVDDYEE